MLVKLDHIQLAMPKGEEAKARAFYHGMLELEELEKPETLNARGGCWFAGPGLRLHLGVEEPFQPARKAHPAFQVADLAALAEKLAKHHYEVIWDTLLPMRRFYSADAFGNRIEFLENYDNPLQLRQTATIA